MKYAFLYNVFTCWMVTLIGLATFHDFMRRSNRNLVWTGYAHGWLFASGLWFCAGLRLLASLAGWMAVDRGLFYLDQCFLALQLVANNLFVSARLFSDRRRIKFLVAFTILSQAVFLILLFSLGITKTEHTAWASEHELPRAAFLSFLVGYALCIGLVLYGIIKDVVERWRRGSWGNADYTLATASLGVYGLAGIADVRGILAGGGLLLIRLLYLVAVLTAFWIARSDRSRIKLIRPGKDA